MLLDFPDLVAKYDMHITGVLHVGAHLGEEAEAYRDLGITNVVWIEGNPGVIPKLRSILEPYGHQLIQALITDADGDERTFHVTNYDGMSSSIYEFGQLHLDSSPDTVFVRDEVLSTRTIDSIVAEYGIVGCNMLAMDLQGAELLALRGATQLLPNIDYIYTEVNEDYVYQGCALVSELDALLSDFDRVETSMTPARWGDALYVRRP